MIIGGKWGKRLLCEKVYDFCDCFCGFRASMINRLGSSCSLQITVAPDVAKKGKSLVDLFGIASRSLPNTWSQIHKKIIIPTEKSGYDVTVHIINNDIGDVSCKNKQKCAKHNEFLKKDPLLLNMRRQMFLE